LLWVIDLSWG
ncbi:putative transmembrane domain protein, partial [Chlamydia psittaci 84-8471/1]